MPFADAEAGVPAWAVGVATVVAAVLGAAVPALIQLMKAKSGLDSKSESLSIKTLKEQVKVQGERIGLLEAKVESSSRNESRCREREVQMYGFIVLQHGQIKRQNAAMIQAGIPVEPIEDVPALPPFRSHEEIEFEERSLAQGTQVIRDVADRAQGGQP